MNELMDEQRIWEKKDKDQKWIIKNRERERERERESDRNKQNQTNKQTKIK